MHHLSVVAVAQVFYTTTMQGLTYSWLHAKDAQRNPSRRPQSRGRRVSRSKPDGCQRRRRCCALHPTLALGNGHPSDSPPRPPPPSVRASLPRRRGARRRRGAAPEAALGCGARGAEAAPRQRQRGGARGAQACHGAARRGGSARTPQGSNSGLGIGGTSSGARGEVRWPEMRAPFLRLLPRKRATAAPFPWSCLVCGAQGALSRACVRSGSPTSAKALRLAKRSVVWGSGSLVSTSTSWRHFDCRVDPVAIPFFLLSRDRMGQPP